MLTAATFKRIWKNEYFKTAITVILIVALVFGIWLGAQIVLHTQYPALAVASGSMCTVKGMRCEGWDHPFSPTLHKGDLIIIQGVDSKKIHAASYPNGDIIVFHKPKTWENSPDELIVHRAIKSEINPNNGLIYFKTKGDANSAPDHHTDYRGVNYTWNGLISEKLVVGKVILRIPWLGHLALLMHNFSGIFIIFLLILLLVIVEFLIPLFSGEETETEGKENPDLIP